MSIANLFSPNTYDLFANSITAGTQTITTINATIGNITTLNSTTGNITTLNSTTGNITTANITINNTSQLNVDQIRPLVLNNNINLDPTRGAAGIGMVAIHNLNGFDALFDTNAVTMDRIITFPDSNLTLVGVTSATGTATFSGVWAANQTALFDIQKVGTLVICRINPIGPAVANTNAFITSDAFIPVGFRPTSANVSFNIGVIDAVTPIMGTVLIRNNGTLQIGSNLNSAFVGANSTGVSEAFILTWTTTA